MTIGVDDKDESGKSHTRCQLQSSIHASPCQGASPYFNFQSINWSRDKLKYPTRQDGEDDI